MENNFNLKKFLTENKLTPTSNARLVNEGRYNMYSPHNFDGVNAEAKKRKNLIQIANELFPEHGGELENFKPLSKDEISQVYKAYTEKHGKSPNISELSEDVNIPDDIIFTDDDPQIGHMDLMGRSVEDLDEYDVEVYGYSPSTGKAYKGMTGGSFGATDFDDVDGIEEMNPRETKNYIDAMKKYDPEHYERMVQAEEM